MSEFIKFTNSGLSFSLFYFSLFIFLFSIFRTTRVRVDQSCGHIRWQSHKIDHETKENLVKGSRISNIIQYGQHMLASCFTHSRLG